LAGLDSGWLPSCISDILTSVCLSVCLAGWLAGWLAGRKKEILKVLLLQKSRGSDFQLFGYTSDQTSVSHVTPSSVVSEPEYFMSLTQNSFTIPAYKPVQSIYLT